MSKDIYAIVGESVRRERLRAKLTVERLAEAAGISPTFLSYIETQGRKASLRTIQRLADALRIPVAGLFRAVPIHKTDGVYNAGQEFIHLIRGKGKSEIGLILAVAKAVSRTITKR